MTVDVAIPLGEAAASTLLADLIKRRAVGDLIGRWLRPDENGDRLLAAIVAKHSIKKGNSMSKGPTSVQFRNALNDCLSQAARDGQSWVDIGSRDLHVQVGGYPGAGHRMPACCAAMHAARGQGDEVLEIPPSGQGATLIIRYRLPRPN